MLDENRADQRHAGCLGNLCRRFARRTVLSLCRRSRVLNWSGKFKRDSNAVSNCRENCETLCPCYSLTGSEHEHSVLHFSWQLLTTFESRFDFPDRLDMHKHSVKPKAFRGVYHSLRFQAGPSSPVQCTSTVNRSFLSNHRIRALFCVSGPT